MAVVAWKSCHGGQNRGGYQRVSWHRSGGWARRLRPWWRLANGRRKSYKKNMSLFSTSKWIFEVLTIRRWCTCWGWSARNRRGDRLSWSYPCVWPSWHERVVTTAGTGVVSPLTGHIFDHSLTGHKIWPLRSLATDGSFSLSLPTYGSPGSG
jgi:hypothetical protein